MILMALLPKPDDKPVAHHGSSGYPATKDLWDTIMKQLEPRIGTALADGRYELTHVQLKRITIKRKETQSSVNVARSRIEKTYERLLAGAEIKHRGIDYTVAKEFGVLLALGSLVEDDGKVYRLAKRS